MRYVAFLSLALLTQAAEADTVIGGFIRNDTTLTLADSPYNVISSLLVVHNATLTIEPGVEMYFDESKGLRIEDGLLNLAGTAAQPILMTASDPAMG